MLNLPLKCLEYWSMEFNLTLHSSHCRTGPACTAGGGGVTDDDDDDGGGETASDSSGDVVGIVSFLEVFSPLFARSSSCCFFRSLSSFWLLSFFLWTFPWRWSLRTVSEVTVRSQTVQTKDFGTGFGLGGVGGWKSKRKLEVKIPLSDDEYGKSPDQKWKLYSPCKLCLFLLTLHG